MPQDTARTIAPHESERIQTIDLYLSEPHEPDDRMLHVAGEAYQPRSNQYRVFSALVHWRGGVNDRLQRLIDDRLGAEWILDTWWTPDTPF